MDAAKRQQVYSFIANHAQANGLAVNSSNYDNGRAAMYGGTGVGRDPKHHCLYYEFGYKDTLTYQDMRNLYDRQGIAGGFVDSKAMEAFNTNPWLVEGDEDSKNKDETTAEKEFKRFAKRLGLWRIYQDVTIRRSVGNYAALILQIADDQPWNVKASNVKPEDIVGLLPVWEHQLTVNQTEQDTLSPDYGEPLSYSYNEYDYNGTGTQNSTGNRSVTIDASRVVYFGDLFANGSATLLGNLVLQKGYNDAITLEKLIGAGGEGAYKNAARHLATLFDPTTNISDLAKSMGVDVDEFQDVMNDVARDLNSNFDATVTSTARDVKILSTSLPDMDTTFNNAMSSFAASVGYPSTWIVGMQTGERASSEDGKVVAKKTTSYRGTVLDYEILFMMRHLSKLGLWMGVDWSVAWDSLLDASQADKVDIALKMSQTTGADGQSYYTAGEIRVAGGQEPEIEMSEEEKKLREQGEELTDDELAGEE